MPDFSCQEVFLVTGVVMVKTSTISFKFPRLELVFVKDIPNLSDEWSYLGKRYPQFFSNNPHLKVVLLKDIINLLQFSTSISCLSKRYPQFFMTGVSLVKDIPNSFHDWELS